MTVMKQNMKSQANTQDSLRAAVSHLDKQVQVLPSTLAKQLAHPPEQHDILPKGDAEAAHQQQQQQAQQAQVAETQLTSWSEALEQQQDSEATLAARAAFLHQQQQVPLSRQLMEDTSQQPAVVTAAAAAAVGNSPRQQQQQQQQQQLPQTLPAVTSSAAEPAAPQATVVQFDSSHLEGNISEVRISTLQLKAELSKHNQKVQALTQRLETLERRPLARTVTRKEGMAAVSGMARAPSNALASGETPSPRPGSEAALPAGTTAADSTPAVAAPATAGQPSSSSEGPSVNFAADSQSASIPSVSNVKDPAGTSSSAITSGAGASAASSPAPARSEASASKPEEEGTPQASGEDKENDAAAVTAVIWKELAELSAVQAKLKAAVGSGVEDVREVRQRLVSLESGMVKTQRQEDKRGLDLLQKLSDQQSKVTSFASELEASNQKTETRCTNIRKEVSKALSEQRQQLSAHSEAMAKKMEFVATKADRAAQELPSLVAPISRGLNAAVERLSVLEHSCLRQGDAVQAPDLETALARAMEGPRAGIHNVEQHVSQLEQRLEDCLAHKADAAEVPTNYQVAQQVGQVQQKAQAALQAVQDQVQDQLDRKADKGGVQAGEAGLTQRCGQLETALLQGLQQVTDRAATALSLKADGEEVNELRLFVKGQLADVRSAAKEGAGRGRLSYTTWGGHTLCLSCDQPLAPLRGHTHDPLAPQGVYPVPEEGASDAWAPTSAPISANEPIGADAHRSSQVLVTPSSSSVVSRSQAVNGQNQLHFLAAAINARHQAEKRRLQMAMAPDNVPPARTSTPELADLSTNPAAIRAANPRLKPQTISGSIAQGNLPAKQGRVASSAAARRLADANPARRTSK
ncbi:hypothetical protein ABBQ38_009436 [Trebouxia sp. C0009 RCD-2024]